MKTDHNAVYISLTGYSDTTLDLANYIGNLTEKVYLSGTLTLGAGLEILHTGITKGNAVEVYSTASVTVGAFEYKVLGRVIPALKATKRWKGAMLASGTNAPQFYLDSDSSESGYIGIGDLDITGELDNTHLKAGAGIEFTKMESLTSSRIPVIGSGGKIEASTVTATQLSYLSSVSSDIQTQINSKLSSAATTLSDANIAANADIGVSKLAALTADKAPVLDGSGKLAASSVTATELGYLSGLSSNAQTQISGKVSKTLAQGSIFVGNGSSEAVALDAKTSGQLLLGNGTTVASVPMSSDATISASGALTIANNAVTPAKVSAEMRKEIITVPFSFETNHSGAVMKVYIPYACSVTYIHASVIKALAATDSGFITFANNAGTVMTGSNLTAGKLELAASTPQSSVVVSTATGNNSFTAGQVLQITASKATVGGNGLLTIELTRG